MNGSGYTIVQAGAEVPAEEFVRRYVDLKDPAAGCRPCPDYGRYWTCPPYDVPAAEYWGRYETVLLRGMQFHFTRELLERRFTPEELAEALEVSGQLTLDIGAAAKEFAAEAQMFFAARDPSSAGIANEAFRRLWHLLRKLPLYELLLRREDAPSCFTSDEDCRKMWDEMMTRGTQAHDDYAHWIARLSRIGQDLNDFRRNTQWMLSAYFAGLPSCKRENYIDAYGRFKDGIGKAKLADIDEESDPFYDPPVASFRFDFPAHISFIPYRDEKTGKPKMAERSTFDDLIAFFYLDLTRGIAAGNLPRRCKNCGHWFVAVGGYNTQYCDRPILGQHGKTCRSVGAHETAKRKLREAAAKEYARTYNRLKGRKQRGTISTDEWNHIVAVAEELRAAFQAGEMAESEYCRKLKAL